MDVALQANMYARAYILEGTTQLITNTYDLEKKLQIKKLLTTIRNPSNKYPGLTLEVDRAIIEFYRTVEDCKKLSVGNCHELSLMALDYVAHHAPHVSAEIYNITGGDHAFLVVGRKKGSNPANPGTWGKDAYISDPWSDMVYPATEYLSKTKNYYNTPKGVEDYTNHIEDFNPAKHRLQPMANQNTHYIRTTQSEDHLLKVKTLFKTKIGLVLAATQKLNNNLEKISNRLLKLYGESDEKYIVLKKMITELRTLHSAIKADLSNINFQENYATLRSTLEEKLTASVEICGKATTISAEDKQTLNKYKKEGNFFTKVMQFFKIKSQTVRDMHKAEKEFEATLDRIKNKRP